MNLPEGYLAEYLTILYHGEKHSVPIGIALYIASLDALHFYFREDFDFASDEDAEILAATAQTFEAFARDLGPAATFSWLNSTLSNRIFVEGPNPVMVTDPEQSVENLFKQICLSASLRQE